MGHTVRGCMIIASIVILGALIMSGYKIDLRIRTPQCFDIHFDEKFSDASKFEITKFVESIDKRLVLKAATFTSIIKERFPFIQSIQCRLVPPGIMKLTCKAAQPLCVINKTLLLMPTGAFCSSDYFHEINWATLPCMFVEQYLLKTYGPAAIVSIIHKLGVDICANYRVRLSSERTIVFDDNKQPRLSLVCRPDNIPSKNMCGYGNYVREILENRGAFTEKSDIYFLADLRFEKQIILSKK